jgi:chromosome segregation ATPase
MNVQPDLATWQWIIVTVAMPIITLLGKDVFDTWRARRKAEFEAHNEARVDHLEDLRSAIKNMGDRLDKALAHVVQCETDLAASKAELEGLKGRMEGYERAMALLRREMTP